MRHVGRPIPPEIESEYESAIMQLNDWEDTVIVATFYHPAFDNSIVIKMHGQLLRIT